MGGGTLHAFWRRFRPAAQRAAFPLLDTALEAGCTAFDTAAVYGGGLGEVILGRWIRSRRVRDQVLILTKGGHPDANGVRRVHPAFLARDLHDSLRRLRVEHVDLYLLHRDDPTIPVGLIMSGLHRFVQAGKVRQLGASNWSHTRIEAANAYAYAHGLTPFTVSSPHFSLAEMHAPPWPGCISITGAAGTEARAWYRATEMPVLAWSPLAGGFLAGRDELDDAQSAAYLSESNRERRDRAKALAREHGVALAQIALAYLLAQPMDVHPIVAASTPEKLRVLFGTRLELSAAELAWLEGGAPPSPKAGTVKEECRLPS
jgi:aryl-alcohol dehydrogenase-like predicted oxidoreductase